MTFTPIVVQSLVRSRRIWILTESKPGLLPVISSILSCFPVAGRHYSGRDCRQSAIDCRYSKAGWRQSKFD